MAIFLLAWLAAAAILVGIDLRARFAGEPRGREGLLIWGFAIGLAAVTAFWFSR